eukprot:1230039-Pyramimonas_sp.AAC.1
MRPLLLQSDSVCCWVGLLRSVRPSPDAREGDVIPMRLKPGGWDVWPWCWGTLALARRGDPFPVRLPPSYGGDQMAGGAGCAVDWDDWVCVASETILVPSHFGTIKGASAGLDRAP